MRFLTSIKNMSSAYEKYKQTVLNQEYKLSKDNKDNVGFVKPKTYSQKIQERFAKKVGKE